MEEFKLDKESAIKEIEETDQERANYCKHFTGKQWKDAENYDLTLDSSLLGIEKSIQIITEAIKNKS